MKPPTQIVKYNSDAAQELVAYLRANFDCIPEHITEFTIQISMHEPVRFTASYWATVKE